MQLSVTEREQLYAILEKYDQNPKVQQMREFSTARTWYWSAAG